MDGGVEGSRNLHFTRENTRQRVHLILKPWKRGGLEDFSRTKEDEMIAATFDPLEQRRISNNSDQLVTLCKV
jgi:hypothetical protein